MSYMIFSDFIDYTRPDKRDIYILFKAIVNVMHNSPHKGDISVNIENILYDRDKGKISFIECRIRRRNFYYELDELINYLISRLRYAGEDVYEFIKSIRYSFDNYGIKGIYNVLSAYEEKVKNEKKAVSVSDLIFIMCIITAQILYYKITGIYFFK